MTRETENSHVTGDDLFMVHFTTLSESRGYAASNEGIIKNMATMRNFGVLCEKFNFTQNSYVRNMALKLTCSVRDWEGLRRIWRFTTDW